MNEEIKDILKGLAENQEEIEMKTSLELPNPPEFIMDDIEKL